MFRENDKRRAIKRVRQNGRVENEDNDLRPFAVLVALQLLGNVDGRDRFASDLFVAKYLRLTISNRFRD